MAPTPNVLTGQRPPNVVSMPPARIDRGGGLTGPTASAAAKTASPRAVAGSAAPARSGESLPSGFFPLLAITVAAFTAAGIVAGVTGGQELYQSVVGFVSGVVALGVAAGFVAVPIAIVTRALGLRSRTLQRWRRIVVPSLGAVFAGLFVAMFVLLVIGSSTGWIAPS